MMRNSSVQPLVGRVAASARAMPRVGVVCDLREEGWYSMDLVAEMLIAEIQKDGGSVSVTPLRPPMVRRASRFVGRRAERLVTLDRIINRYWDYPRWLAELRNRFDVFHVVDHTYAHVVHVLPASRTVVTCHDSDAFLPLVRAEINGSKLPTALARRTLAGLRRASLVTCDSEATRANLAELGLVPETRTRVVPNGVHPSCSPTSDVSADAELERLLDANADADTYLLHVGSVIPRKRIDRLLRVLAAVREVRPEVRLIRVGGAMRPEQVRLMRALGQAHAVITLPHLDRRLLAAAYRKALLLLLPSDREGFGLPVVEALASGTPAVVSDLEVLREVGGSACVYCEGDERAWAETLLGLIREASDRPDRWAMRRSNALERARVFSWQRYADTMTGIYQELGRERPDKIEPTRSHS